jgi:hypothetical protein
VEIGPLVQIMPVRAADHAQDRRRPLARVLAADEQPILPFMRSFA